MLNSPTFDIEQICHGKNYYKKVGIASLNSRKPIFGKIMVAVDVCLKAGFAPAFGVSINSKL